MSGFAASRRVVLLGVIALFAAGVGVSQVLGAIPNPSDGRYYACFERATGAVRLINYPRVSTCPAGQRLIDWSRMGPQGPAGITRIVTEYVFEEETIAESRAQVSVTCPIGSRVTGGGFSVPPGGIQVVDSRPDGPRSWVVRVIHEVNGLNGQSPAPDVRAWAVCMSTEPSSVIAPPS